MQKHYAISDSIVGLTEILNDEINLAIWQRTPDPLGVSFAEQVVANGAHLSDNRVVDVSNDQAPDLTDLLQAYSHYAGHAEFVEDVSGLVQAYSFLLGASRIGLRLRVLEKAMCPRFHVDYVSVRLITTYVGVGSEWLEEHKVERAPLLQGGETDTAPNRLNAGDVALFKGERWSGNEGRGIIHRSPMVDDNQRRLILTLDWLR
jgi:hypothetical protein